MDIKKLFKHIAFNEEVQDIMESALGIVIPADRSRLIRDIFGGDENMSADVIFDVPTKGKYKEAYVSKCKNGIAVNFTDVYMRRRDPDAMVIADDFPTNKKTYKERFKQDFSSTRIRTFEWLKKQELYVIPFYAGGKKYEYLTVALVPKQAAFFALILMDLQGYIPLYDLPVNRVSPKSIMYVAPPFRHTHFDGKQVVVHLRSENMHEVFSYNLYPGPSAKKGVYSILLNIGEKEKPPWPTLHCSAVKVVTPYECELVFMHEGASGGGKTEMTQDPHLTKNGLMTLAVNPDTEDSIMLGMRDICTLYPVVDDMGITHPKEQNGRKLQIEDAEQGWFLRVDHLKEYGTDPQLEALCISPPEPLVFLNIDAKPGATTLIWEHIYDAPDSPCPNPRVVIPRKYIPNIVEGIVSVDIRSIGVRAPRSTREEPSYGIFGIMHILPPALAWLWRLVAPRGYANPSIVATGKGLKSEGVGSYWPFAIGVRVDQANVLLRQIQDTAETRYLLIPNQFIGAYKVGFNAQWLTREYIARRGGVKYKRDRLIAARCPLLGYTPDTITFNSTFIPRGLLRVEEQQEVGIDAYDKGAEELILFFKKELELYKDIDGLNSLGKRIISICLDDGNIDDYANVLSFRI